MIERVCADRDLVSLFNLYGDDYCDDD